MVRVTTESNHNGKGALLGHGIIAFPLHAYLKYSEFSMNLHNKTLNILTIFIDQKNAMVFTEKKTHTHIVVIN